MIRADRTELCRTEQLGYHLGVALDNGLRVEELSEAITHPAFYAGRPNAMTAINQLDAVADERNARLAAVLVRFAPGARTNWHSHTRWAPARPSSARSARNTGTALPTPT